MRGFKHLSVDDLLLEEELVGKELWVTSMELCDNHPHLFDKRIGISWLDDLS